MEQQPSPAALAAPPDSRPVLDFLKHNFREYGMLISLVAIMAFFQVMTEGTLMQPLNLTNLVLQNSYIVIMALGMLLVIVAGHNDLSVGSVCGFIGALAAVLMVSYEWHFVPASLVCLLVGGVIGGAQGWFVAFFRLLWMFPCDRTTSRGVAVEPEVYWVKAGSALFGTYSRHRPASLAGMESELIQRSSPSSGASARMPSMPPMIMSVVIAKVAPASWAMACKRGRVRWVRIGSGG